MGNGKLPAREGKPQTGEADQSAVMPQVTMYMTQNLMIEYAILCLQNVSTEQMDRHRKPILQGGVQ